MGGGEAGVSRETPSPLIYDVPHGARGSGKYRTSILRGCSAVSRPLLFRKPLGEGGRDSAHSLWIAPSDLGFLCK